MYGWELYALQTNIFVDYIALCFHTLKSQLKLQPQTSMKLTDQDRLQSYAKGSFSFSMYYKATKIYVPHVDPHPSTKTSALIFLRNYMNIINLTKHMNPFEFPFFWRFQPSCGAHPGIIRRVQLQSFPSKSCTMENQRNKQLKADDGIGLPVKLWIHKPLCFV